MQQNIAWKYLTLENSAAMFLGGVILFKTVNGGIPIQIEGHGVAPDQI